MSHAKELREIAGALLAHGLERTSARLAAIAAELEPRPVTGPCCELRCKVALLPSIVEEERCGVSDSALADVMVWDLKSPQGRAVITFRFCPWCGARWTHTGVLQELGGEPA